MVAIVRSEPARNIVRKKATTPSLTLVESRHKSRARVALASWLCSEHGSTRGYALDLSPDGARFGGMGRALVVGQRVLAKIAHDRVEAPFVLRAEVVRYQGADVCVRFLDAPGVETMEEQCRLRAFVATLRCD